MPESQGIRVSRLTPRSRVTCRPEFCTGCCLLQTVTSLGLLLRLTNKHSRPFAVRTQKMGKTRATLRRPAPLWRFLGNRSLYSGRSSRKHITKENTFLGHLKNMHQNSNVSRSVGEDHGVFFPFQLEEWTQAEKNLTIEHIHCTEKLLKYKILQTRKNVTLCVWYF